MEIQTGNKIVVANKITTQDETITIYFDRDITQEDQRALQSGYLDIGNGYTVYSGYTNFVESSITLRKATANELADMKAALEELGVKKEGSWLESVKKEKDKTKTKP